MSKRLINISRWTDIDIFAGDIDEIINRLIILKSDGVENIDTHDTSSGVNITLRRYETEQEMLARLDKERKDQENFITVVRNKKHAEYLKLKEEFEK